MMIIALFANMNKSDAYGVAREMRDFLQARGATVVARDEESAALQVAPLSSVDPKKLGALISLGGDGTILRLVHHYPHLEAPILGVNLGHLGFMADVPLAEIYPCLKDLLEGKYRIENRLMLEGSTGGKSSFALNDVVVHRGQNKRLIDLSIHIDGIYVNTFSADGLIFSTANGSTAYSLSAGGPILTPELDAFVITPINPHTISNRPIVFMPKESIEVQYLSAYDPIEVTFDGFSAHTLATNETVKLFRSKRSCRMVSLDRINYFWTLRTKLGWAGQVRYNGSTKSDSTL